MPAAFLLDDKTFALETARLPAPWQLAAKDSGAKGNALIARFSLDSYACGLSAVAQIGAQAEASDHHPELTLVWGALTVRYATHSANGITALDIAAALQTSQIMAAIHA
ncbi:MAG: 4a-hydroxytetrahydrobiopterin dehydratase [Vampirovibrionales bacterium]|nr:4a-hydroxytetrahydrobiopterin dehydratase [Vampirovibrionales bacterium]